MSDAPGEILADLESIMDPFLQAVGVPELVIAGFDAATETAESLVDGENVLVAVGSAVLIVGVAAAIGSEALALGVIGLVGEEAVTGAVFAINSYVLPLIPQLGALTSGELVVASAATSVGAFGLKQIINQPLKSLVTAGVDELDNLMVNSGLISVQPQADGSLTSSDQQQAIITLGGSVGSSTGSDVSVFGDQNTNETVVATGVGIVADAGYVTIGAGAYVIITGVSTDIGFSDSSGTAVIANASSFTGTIYQFRPGDVIDLPGVGTATYAELVGNNLYVPGVGGGVGLTLDPNQDYSSYYAVATPNGSGGTDITLASVPTAMPETGTTTINYDDSGNPISTEFDQNYSSGDSSSLIFAEDGGFIGADFSDSSGGNYDGVLSIGAYQNVNVPADGNNYILVFNYPVESAYLDASNVHVIIVSNDTSVTHEIEGPGVSFSAAISEESTDPVQIVSPVFGVGTERIETVIEGVLDDNGNLETASDGSGYIATSISFVQIDTYSDLFGYKNFVTYNTILSLPVDLPCYLAGTAIATPEGSLPIEALVIGQLIVTASGQLRPIKWIGHRYVDCRYHSDRQQVWPVCIHVGAFGRGLPARDLFLSPEHAVFSNGVLIPIKHLINGSSIIQEQRDRVSYWHIEFEEHDVILAEGLPCESYLDNGSRSAFNNSGKVVQLHPVFSPAERCEATSEAKAYAPLHITGEVVERVRARLRRQAIRLKYAPIAAPRRSHRQDKPVPASIDRAALVRPAWYLTNNPDVAAAGVDPQLHYEAYGRQEGRLPRPEAELIRALGLIDPATVIRTMPDVVASGIDVAEHFCGCGWKEGRRPNAYFDIAWYQRTYAVPTGMNPLIHYVLFGEEQGLAPSLHFDPAWYRRRYGLAPSVCALAHYLQHRRTQQFSPLPSFDVAAHVQANQATLRPNRDPYLHFLVSEQFVSASERRAAA